MERRDPSKQRPFFLSFFLFGFGYSFFAPPQPQALLCLQEFTVCHWGSRASSHGDSFPGSKEVRQETMCNQWINAKLPCKLQTQQALCNIFPPHPPFCQAGEGEKKELGGDGGGGGQVCVQKGELKQLADAVTCRTHLWCLVWVRVMCTQWINGNSRSKNILSPFHCGGEREGQGMEKNGKGGREVVLQMILNPSFFSAHLPSFTPTHTRSTPFPKTDPTLDAESLQTLLKSTFAGAQHGTEGRSPGSSPLWEAECLMVSAGGIPACSSNSGRKRCLVMGAGSILRSSPVHCATLANCFNY